MHDLLSEDFSKPIIEWVGDSERINYYLHDSAGFKYDINTKTNIYTHRYDSSEISFVEDIFDYLDRNIDLDFTRVFDRNLANIEITKADDNANLLGNNSLGYAQALTDGNRSWMDLWWMNVVPNLRDNRYTEYTVLSEIESFTIVHEIGHGLGLDHPRKDPYGKWHNSNDTIMTYNRKQISGNKALNFSTADISTLQLVYGKEDDGNTSQSKIPNNSERRSLLNQITNHNHHALASKNINFSKDELIGLYEKETIYEPFEKDDLLNNGIDGNDLLESTTKIENNLMKFENYLLNESIGLELLNFENESVFREDNILISKNKSDKDTQNTINNEYLLNNNDEYNSNLNYINIDNNKFI